jgi:predicted TIM-barrel fold metal-dependent hydrolase
MIVDVHYHLVPKVQEETAGPWVDLLSTVAKRMGKRITRETLLKEFFQQMPDPTGERLLASMDSCGIDFTCICAMDNADDPFLTPKSAQSQNKIVGEIAQKYPNRVMALAGVDPRRPEAPDMMKQCFDEYGVRGLKYHPDVGYDPSGPSSYKVLEIVQKNNGILLTHTGPLMPPLRNKYANPELLADIGVDFPDLRVIAAHSGQINWRPWAALAFYQSNLYGDLAMWDVFAFSNYENFCRDLRGLIDYAGISKIFFGTDNPFCSILEPTKNWIQLIKDLPESAPAGITFSQEEVDAILGGNAVSMLGLEPPT